MSFLCLAATSWALDIIPSPLHRKRGVSPFHILCVCGDGEGRRGGVGWVGVVKKKMNVDTQFATFTTVSGVGGGWYWGGGGGGWVGGGGGGEREREMDYV